MYAGLGVVAFLPSWLHGASHTLQCGGCQDNGQEVWFLAWAAHALTHLQDPWRSNWINVPWGVDLADNTSMPFAGFLGLPITLVFGPIATYNVMLSFAFASSATAAMVAFRRWVASPMATFLGGLLYGFSPYMVGQGTGHLFALFAPVPPLVLLTLDEILVRQRRSWWVAGGSLGLLGLLQLGWSAEIFAETALVGVVGVVVLGAFRWHLVRARLPYAARALGLAVVLISPLFAVFAWISHTGAEHLAGPIHPVAMLAPLSTDLASLVVPTSNQHLSFGVAAFGSSLLAMPNGAGPRVPDVTENGAYIGLPLLTLLLVGIWRWRRDGLVRFAGAMALVSLVLSMGSKLRVWGHDTGVPLPFVVLTKLPLVQSEIASRYSLFLWLFVSLLVARIMRMPPARPGIRRSRARTRRSSAAYSNVTLALASAGVLTLVPSWPTAYNIAPASIPTWFRSPAVGRVPWGSTVLTYPLARSTHALPMLWQAVNGIRYRIPAGHVVTPRRHDAILEAAFDTCDENPLENLPPRTFVNGSRAELRLWRVHTIVVPFQYSINPSCAVRFLKEVVGRPPHLEYGAAVWRLGP